MTRHAQNLLTALGAAAALLLGACAGSPDPANRPPTAVITFDPPSGTTEAPAQVTLTSARSIDPDGLISAYAWYLDGRLASREASFVARFDDPGSHVVRLLLEDDRGGKGEATSEYVVLERPTTGTARFLGGDLVVDAGVQDTAAVEVESSHPWTLTSSAPWLVPEPASGAPGVTEVTLAIDRGSVTPGATATLTLTGVLGAADAVSVTVLLPALAGPTPGALGLQATVGGQATAGFRVGNTGLGTLHVEFEPSAPWLTVNPLTVSVGPGGSADLGVTVACEAPGQREATVAVATNVPDTPHGVVQVTVECAPAPEPEFDITVRYFGDALPTPPQRAVFEAAAARWAEVVVGDLPDVYFTDSRAGRCGRGEPGLTDELVDDLLIWVKVEEIDGPGNILGSAGPCLLRGDAAAPRLPVMGVMVLDEADLASMDARGILLDVILHEMGHVLGIGTLWQYGAAGHMLLDAPCQPGQPQRRFIGPAANAKHVEAGGQQDLLLVEDRGGSGTACAHWAEDRYLAELMTGWVGGGGNPLSAITAGSLEDLGYVVSYARVDAYHVPLPGEVGAAGALVPLEEVLLTNPGFVD